MRTVGLLLTALLLPTIAFASTININVASPSELETLPGIGPTKAAAIVTYRSQKGPFAKTADIQNVKGIGAVTYANLKDLITVGVVTDTTTVPEKPIESQPSPTPPSYTKVQTVETISHTEPTVAHDEPVLAPAVATEIAAAGASLPDTAGSSLFHSMWSLGLIGIMVLAGGAFIFI